jgi:hypothetical protein
MERTMSVTATCQSSGAGRQTAGSTPSRARQREIDRIEGQRAKLRAQARDSILGSRLDGNSPSPHGSAGR